MDALPECCCPASCCCCEINHNECYQSNGRQQKRKQQQQQQQQPGQLLLLLPTPPSPPVQEEAKVAELERTTAGQRQLVPAETTAVALDARQPSRPPLFLGLLWRRLRAWRAAESQVCAQCHCRLAAELAAAPPTTTLASLASTTAMADQEELTAGCEADEPTEGEEAEEDYQVDDDEDDDERDEHGDGGQRKAARARLVEAAASTAQLAVSAVARAPPSAGQQPGERANTQQAPRSPNSLLVQQQRQSTLEGVESKRERKAAKTLAIITGVFVICWLPFFVMAITMALLQNKPHKFLFAFLLWLGYFNSMLNPIIYTIFSPDFRKAFKRLLCAMETGNTPHKGAQYRHANGARGKPVHLIMGQPRQRWTWDGGGADDDHDNGSCWWKFLLNKFACCRKYSPGSSVSLTQVTSHSAEVQQQQQQQVVALAQGPTTKKGILVQANQRGFFSQTTCSSPVSQSVADQTAAPTNVAKQVQCNSTSPMVVLVQDNQRPPRSTGAGGLSNPPITKSPSIRNDF